VCSTPPENTTSEHGILSGGVLATPSDTSTQCRVVAEQCVAETMANAIVFGLSRFSRIEAHWE
jgi:hypothetical protein